MRRTSRPRLVSPPRSTSHSVTTRQPSLAHSVSFSCPFTSLRSAAGRAKTLMRNRLARCPGQDWTSASPGRGDGADRRRMKESWSTKISECMAHGEIGEMKKGSDVGCDCREGVTDAVEGRPDASNEDEMVLRLRPFRGDELDSSSALPLPLLRMPTLATDPLRLRLPKTGWLSSNEGGEGGPSSSVMKLSTSRRFIASSRRCFSLEAKREDAGSDGFSLARWSPSGRDGGSRGACRIVDPEPAEPIEARDSERARVREAGCAPGATALSSSSIGSAAPKGVPTLDDRRGLIRAGGFASSTSSASSSRVAASVALQLAVLPARRRPFRCKGVSDSPMSPIVALVLWYGGASWPAKEVGRGSLRDASSPGTVSDVASPSLAGSRLRLRSRIPLSWRIRRCSRAKR